MKKNILIIGYGDIAMRLSAILSKDRYEIYGISRSKKRGLENFIKWDWSSKDLPNIECKNFDSIIFICLFPHAMGREERGSALP